MYVDFGKRRGRLHFTWKELCAIAGVLSVGAGYVVRAEVKFAMLGAQVVQCQHELQMLKHASTGSGDVRSIIQTAATKDGR